MSQESFENLGFTEENLLKTEEERKKELALKFLQATAEARDNVQNYFKEMYKSGAYAEAEKPNENNTNKNN